MKTFTNQNPGTVDEAIELVRTAREDGHSVSFAGGGTDLLQLVKERVVNRSGQDVPDVLVNLKSLEGVDQVSFSSLGGVAIGGLTTLSNLANNPRILDDYKVLAEAAGQVGTPQIRNAGTLAGNVCQRPWCWYYRNGFPCYKAGGNECFSIAGENQLHAIFGGGPSFIVHPSDVAPALVALDATFNVAGPSGNRVISSSDFFVLPRDNVQHENVLSDDEFLISVDLPAPPNGLKSTYHKVMDRDAWTHALVSVAVVMEMDGDICSAVKIVLGGVAPEPWRVPSAEALLIGNVVTEELARSVGEAAVSGARPLAKNAYKIPLVRGVVARTVLALATSV
ncbi:MAG: molybdopterin dehydrogenase [Rhodospirillaceae bacterium]|nr:molybdopterin dehydrogenase [Rhodospirillaceae bacterium]